MKILLKYYRKMRTFFGMKWPEKKLIAEALVLAGIYRLMILVVPFKKIKDSLGDYMEDSPFEMDELKYKTIIDIRWAIKTVCRSTPWKSNCFVQALTAKKMLRKRKQPYTVYFGIYKDSENSMKAHAWTRCGKVFVTGEKEKEVFTTVAKFSKNY